MSWIDIAAIAWLVQFLAGMMVFIFDPLLPTPAMYEEYARTVLLFSIFICCAVGGWVIVGIYIYFFFLKLRQ